MRRGGKQTNKQTPPPRQRRTALFTSRSFPPALSWRGGKAPCPGAGGATGAAAGEAAPWPAAPRDGQPGGTAERAEGAATCWGCAFLPGRLRRDGDDAQGRAAAACLQRLFPCIALAKWMLSRTLCEILYPHSLSSHKKGSCNFSHEETALSYHQIYQPTNTKILLSFLLSLMFIKFHFYSYSGKCQMK